MLLVWFLESSNI